MNNSKIYNRILQEEEAGNVIYDISHRGGHYGLRAGDVLEMLEIPEEYLAYMPPKFGAYCNYLGGGIRGSISGSGYGKEIPEKYARKLDHFMEACIKRYKAIEDGSGMNSDYPDGSTNWEAEGSRRARQAGIKSAY